MQVLGLTTVAGNVDVKQATRNALLTAEICKSDAPVFMGADKPLTRPHENAHWFHGKDGLGDRKYPAPKRKAEREGAVEAILRLTEAEPGPDPDHARAADQYRACASRRPGTRRARRPLRGDGRRARMRGQCDAGRRIQHLGRSGGGAGRVPLEAQDRNDRLARVARPLGIEGLRDRSGRGDRHGESQIRHRVQRRRARGLSRSDRRDRPLAPIRSRWRCADRSLGLSWSRHRVAIEDAERAHPRHDGGRPARRRRRRQQRKIWRAPPARARRRPVDAWTGRFKAMLRASLA